MIWVGNNEIETAWQHWGGWKDKNPSYVWDDYQKFFLRLLARDVSKNTIRRGLTGKAHRAQTFRPIQEFQGIGDTHYWQVWHAEKPFSEYEKQYPRFMSEYGFQSFPELETRQILHDRIRSGEYRDADHARPSAASSRKST